MSLYYDDGSATALYLRSEDSGWTGTTTRYYPLVGVVFRPTYSTASNYDQPDLPPAYEVPWVRVYPPHYTLAPPVAALDIVRPGHARVAAPRRGTERRHRSSLRRFVGASA